MAFIRVLCKAAVSVRPRRAGHRGMCHGRAVIASGAGLLEVI